MRYPLKAVMVCSAFYLGRNAVICHWELYFIASTWWVRSRDSTLSARIAPFPTLDINSNIQHGGSRQNTSWEMCQKGRDGFD